MSAVTRDVRVGVVLAENHVQPLRGVGYIRCRDDASKALPQLMDCPKLIPPCLLGGAFPQIPVIFQEGLERRQITDLVLSTVEALIGIHQGHRKIDGFICVMLKIHLTYYLTRYTVISISQHAAYVNKESTMDSYTHFATQMHSYRADQFTRSVEKSRLLASLPRKTRTLGLRIEGLRADRKLQPVSSPACDAPA